MITTLIYSTGLVFGLIMVLGALAYWGGRQLIQRRQPDPLTTPAEHNLPYEAVKFPSRYKAKLHGWWIPADKYQGGKPPTVIICHGQAGDMSRHLPQAAFLWRSGYNVLLFNMRAHGESEGEAVTFGVLEKEDLLGAIDFLRSEKEVKEVALMGYSMGAGVAMISAALTFNVSALVLDGIYLKFISIVRASMRQRMPEPLASIATQLTLLGATILTNTRMYQVSPVLWAKHIDQIPVLFIHGERDHLVPLDDVQQLAGDLQNSPYDIWIAPECGHREAFEKLPTEYEQRVLAWLDTHARQPSQPS